MSKKFIGIILGLPILFLGIWGLYLSFLVNTGKDVILPVMGHDPRDLLSGHYITYLIDWDKVDCEQFENGMCPEDKFCTDAGWVSQCRFYIPQEHAEALDKLFIKRNDEDLVFEVVYSYKKGFKATAKELLINGRPWREAI